MESQKCCDNCKFYEWYYDKCKKYNCEVNAKHLCSMYQECKELSEHEKFILSQMTNSNTKTIEEIGLMYQRQLAEIYQQQNFYLNR